MENKLMIINNFKNDLTNIQNELVEKSFSNICSILDIKKLSDWIKDNRIHSIIIFGSRTRLHETSSSDLDLLITDCDALDDVTDDNYLCKQKEIVDYLYKSFKENILINKDIELDFKLNINRFSADYYNGIDANSPISEENDFYFELKVNGPDIGGVIGKYMQESISISFSQAFSGTSLSQEEEQSMYDDILLRYLNEVAYTDRTQDIKLTKKDGQWVIVEDNSLVKLVYNIDPLIFGKNLNSKGDV